MIKWNRARRGREARPREEKRKDAIKREAEREANVEQMNLKDGTTLNNILYQILDADPAVTDSARAKTPISPSAIREIPFEWDSEASTVCIDQMTGNGVAAWPAVEPGFRRQTQCLACGRHQGPRRRREGSVSLATSKRINEAVAAFRSKFMKNSSDFDAGYQDALDYFTTMAGLTRLLNDPSMKAFLTKLDDGEERTVGDRSPS